MDFTLPVFKKTSFLSLRVSPAGFYLSLTDVFLNIDIWLRRKNQRYLTPSLSVKINFKVSNDMVYMQVKDKTDSIRSFSADGISSMPLWQWKLNSFFLSFHLSVSVVPHWRVPPLSYHGSISYPKWCFLVRACVQLALCSNTHPCGLAGSQ